MKILTRYLLRAHLGPFLFAFLALTGVILINTLAKEMANLAGKGLPTRVLFEFFVLSLPANIALTLPMAVLVAVLFTFSQLTSEREVLALRASGVDLRRMVLPLLVVAALIAGGMIWFNDRVLPESNFRWKQLMVDIAQTSPLLAVREQTINPIATGDGMNRYFLQAGQVEATTGRMRDVTIYDVSDPAVGRTIYADSGLMALNPGRTDLVLTLFDGHVRELRFAEPERFQRLGFDRQVLRLQGVSQRLERSETSYRSDREMTVGMMQSRIDTLRTELASVQQRLAADSAREQGARDREGEVEVAEPLGYSGTRVDRERAQSLRYQIREFQVEIQKKYSIAIATLVFVLIGVPLALRFPSGGVGMVIAASLGIFALYYVGLIGGETLADEGYVPPVWAMWAVNIIFAVLGVFGLLRLGREQITGRSAGWGGWPRWLRPTGWRRTRGAEEAEA